MSDPAAVSESGSIHPGSTDRWRAATAGTAGALANFPDGAAEVSPRPPVPLDSPLDVVREADGSGRVHNGEAVVAVAHSAPEPSSARTADTLVLTDGTRLQLRPINADDRDGLVALFDRLSPKSRRRRYLGPKRELTPRELASLTDIDHVCDEAVVAIDERDGSIVGVARYAHSADRASVAEVAVEVADDLHGFGIGTELARRTVHRARTNNLMLLTATTLRENRPARALLRGLGFRTRASHGSAIELALELSPAAKPAAANADLSHTKPGAVS